jgi:hypothetical protein
MAREARSAVNARPGGRVLSIGDLEIHGKGCARLFSPGHDNIPPLWKYARESRDAAGMHRSFRREGLAWLLYNPPSMYFWSQVGALFPWKAREVRILRDFMAQYAEPVWHSSHYDGAHGWLILYRINARPARRPLHHFFVPGTEGEFLALGGRGNTLDPHEDREMDRLDALFGDAGIFLCRKSAIALVKSGLPNAGPGPCRTAADCFWLMARLYQRDIMALAESFPVREVNSWTAPTPRALADYLCSRKASPTPLPAGYSYMEGFPLFLPRAACVGIQ